MPPRHSYLRWWWVVVALVLGALSNAILPWPWWLVANLVGGAVVGLLGALVDQRMGR